MMLMLLIGLVAILGVVEIGYIYWLKRDVQKVADLGSLAGAQRLSACNASNTDNSDARRNAEVDNAFSGTLQIECGHWSATLPQDARFIAPGAGRELNAVRVTASRPALPFFNQLPSMPVVSATATARSSEPVASFSVGSRLLNINGNAPLQGLLRLVGVDLSETEAASYKGLAQVKITPRGLLRALGIPVATDISVGDLNNLLAARQVEVGQLLDVMANLAGEQGVLGANVDLLRSRLASVGVDRLLVRLGSNAGNSGLFASIVGNGPNAGGALDVDLNALGLVGTAIMVANGQHAVDVPQLDILGLVQAKASIVEPASIAIGPVGTTAYNSQVRIFMDIDTQRIPLLGPVLGALGTRVKLPTYIDVIDGFGRLQALNCNSQPATATVDVTSSIANICIGKPVTPWDSTREICATALENEQLITLLGAVTLNHKIMLPALSDRQHLTLAEGETGTVRPNPLAVGTLVSNLVDALLGTLQSLFSPPSNAGDPAQNMARQYLEATKVSGAYQPEAVVSLLRDGNSALPALGNWNTQIPSCDFWLLGCTPKKVQGNVWDGFLYETNVSDPSLIGGLLDVLGVTSCKGLLAGLLAYNSCVQNALAKYLQTKPGGLTGTGSYNPASGNGSCSSILCLLLKPVVDNTLRPLLNGVGALLSSVLGNVLGLELGRSDVTVHAIQCGNAQLVD